MLVTINFDAPDSDRTREWTDAAFAVPGGDTTPPGLIAAYFHLSVDGARVLNYAEWTSADTNRAMADGASQRIQEDPQARHVFASWPGLAGFTIQHYQPFRRLTAS